ncbi:MAG TPA: DEAD/DEAH box helicase [Nitrospiraceae bacterium]|nr:DEAD/DEAH box helicase [Nitrospiraceae bacterium]
MPVINLIESLEKDDRFSPSITEHRYIHPAEPRYKKIDLNENLRGVLKNQGIELFWSHQVEAIDLIRQGENVVVMTPTASGKSLIYNMPVIESIIENPETRALYIFPLKGLEQDQVKNLNELCEAVLSVKGDFARGTKSPLSFGEVYDGDTTAYRRGKIRKVFQRGIAGGTEFPPRVNVIFTNPDMLHLAINPFHAKWEGFFKNLKYVVVDEIHTYRGVFGSNVAHVLRRLRRICSYWGSNPQFIACSATIANPKSLAEELIGLPFKTVTESGAPQAGKHFMFINPVLESPYTEATALFIKCLEAGLKTIVFTKARKITELIYKWTVDRAPQFAEKISPYRAGFLPKERREIEQKLFSGELLGVVSTSALELGVDIGGLDACILAGYPGSISSTWQRAGRVGREGQESLIAMIAIQDALDQYFMKHPDAFFEKSHEAGVIDPENKNIIKKHLPCASSEIYLRAGDSVYDTEKLMPLIEELVQEGMLNPGKRGGIWFSRSRTPHREVEIRAIGKPFDIVDESGRHIGDLSGARIFREAFPGAIYLHRGRQYRVSELLIEERKVICREVDVPYYTQARTKDETEVIEEMEVRKIGRQEIFRGRLRMKNRVTGYDRKNIFDRTKLSRHDLDMPEYVFDTEGLWLTIDKDTENDMGSLGYDLAGSLHAFEHASIACMPLFALCDKGDIGGLSYPFYPLFKKPAIFIYDGYEGGIGLTKRAFEVIDEWFKAALTVISECSCEEGCPSCIQDPQCGSGNQPLDKEGAKFLLERWAG